MAKDLGKKHTCYSCQAKFYDLGKPQAICPKCGANQKDAEDAHPAPSSRSRRAAPVVDVPAVEDDLEDEEPEAEAAVEEDDTLVPEDAVVEEEEAGDDEEEFDE
jgi:uncharacterized protein (TIGR02300 family)